MAPPVSPGDYASRIPQWQLGGAEPGLIYVCVKEYPNVKSYKWCQYIIRKANLYLYDAEIILDIIKKDASTTNHYRLKKGTLTLTQSLLDLPQLHQARSDQAARNAQQNTLHSSSQELVLQTIDAFQQVLIANQLVNIQKNKVKAMQDQLEYTKARFQIGDKTIADLTESEAELALHRPGALLPVPPGALLPLSLIHISEPTRLLSIGCAGVWV